MKRITLLALLALMAFSGKAYAQAGKFGATPEDSVECVKYLSFYKDYYKAGNIKESIPSWRNALVACPEGVTQGLYQDGQNILKYLINREKDSLKKASLIDSLMMMYDIRTKRFRATKSRLSAFTFKVFDLKRFCEGQDARIYKATMDAIDFGKEKADPTLYVFALQSAINMYGKQEMTAEEVMNLYTTLGELFEKKAAVPVGNGEDDKLKDAQSNFETLFAMSGLADCDNLIALFGPKFDEKASDISFVKRAVQLLNNAGCEKSELFLKSVKAMHTLEPSSASAYYLYRLYSSRDEDVMAMEALQEAIDSDESDAATDAGYLVEMGTYYFKKMNQSLKAAEMARKALQADESVAGKANLLLGHIWALAKPSGTEIDAISNFWVAVDYFARAKANDASLTEECDQLIATYRRYFPTIEDAFMHDLKDGDSFQVSYNGMSATTTVRTRK